MPVEHPLTEIDEELRELLAIEPSPEFAARVRQRVAMHQRSGRWWRSRLALAAAAASIVIAAGSLVGPSSPPPVPEPPFVLLRVPSLGLPSSVGMTSPTEPPKRARRVERPPAHPPVAQAPDVVVDLQQQVAIVRLLELARTGTALALPPAAGVTPQTPLTVEPLSVPLINVEPPVSLKGAERSSS